MIGPGVACIKNHMKKKMKNLKAQFCCLSRGSRGEEIDPSELQDDGQLLESTDFVLECSATQSKDRSKLQPTARHVIKKLSIALPGKRNVLRVHTLSYRVWLCTRSSCNQSIVGYWEGRGSKYLQITCVTSDGMIAASRRWRVRCPRALIEGHLYLSTFVS